MIKKHPQFCFAFSIIFFAELFAVTHHLPELRIFTKPLITISLMLFLYFSVKVKSRFTNKVIFGLFFSLLGDVSLLFTSLNSYYFLIGLTAFLIAHLCYISAFYLDSTNTIPVARRHMTPIFLVFGFSCFVFYFNLLPYLGKLSIPVLVYAIIITLMAITAALRFGKTSWHSFSLILIGSIMFILSDSLLAYNKFVVNFELASLLVMVTYMIAQFLIVMGTVDRKYIKMN